MPEQSRANQSAEIAARAHEIAQAARSDIRRVEDALTDRFEKLSEAMLHEFKELRDGQNKIHNEIADLKAENAKRSGVERFLKWALTFAVSIALGLGAIFVSWHSEPPSHH